MSLIFIRNYAVSLTRKYNIPYFISGMDLQFEWEEVKAFVRQPDGSLFSWCERFHCYQHIIYGIVSHSLYLPIPIYIYSDLFLFLKFLFLLICKYSIVYEGNQYCKDLFLNELFTKYKFILHPLDVALHI